MLNYRRHGSGPALVLQHGFLGGGGYFAPQMAALSHAYDIIAPDLPGFAGSRNEPISPSIEALSQAQIQLLDTLGIETFSLLGHSMGGMVALQTALDYPDRIDKLILYATNSSGLLPDRFESFEETLEKFRTSDLSEIAHSVIATWFVHGESAPMFPFCRDCGEGAALDAIVASLQAFSAWDVSTRLGELKMPTLIICGDKDRSYSIDVGVQLAKNINGSQLCLLPDCAHCAHLEKTALFNATLNGFLAENK